MRSTKRRGQLSTKATASLVSDGSVDATLPAGAEGRAEVQCGVLGVHVRQVVGGGGGGGSELSVKGGRANPVASLREGAAAAAAAQRSKKSNRSWLQRMISSKRTLSALLLLSLALATWGILSRASHQRHHHHHQQQQLQGHLLQHQQQQHEQVPKQQAEDQDETLLRSAANIVSSLGTLPTPPSSTASASSSRDKSAAAAASLPALFNFKILKTLPHDGAAFTQGLLYDSLKNGTFYESTGMWGQSSVREVDVATGQVRKKTNNNQVEFGEGLALARNKLYQLTWQTRDLLVYDRWTLQLLERRQHPMTDGWGLTTDASGARFIGSDGTSTIYFFNVSNLREVRRVTVMDGAAAVSNLNELEFFNGFIWANVWQTDCIAKIRPTDGKVVAWLHMPQLSQQLLKEGNTQIDVLNGIAWDQTNKRLFVTGKYWPKLYHISIWARTGVTKNLVQAVRSKCILS